MSGARSGEPEKRSERAYGGPGFEVVEQAHRTIERHGMLDAEDSVLVAVSGGPDSTCLLDVLDRLRHKLGLRLEVAHVDHGLSAASQSIAAAVAARGAEAGFEVHMVRAPDLEGANLHARAREFRYAFLETVAAQSDIKKVATGHTLDDRVETTLARLVHGAGTDGLAGIPSADGVRVRPLIELRRSETRAYCEAAGLTFVDDPANSDDRFERVALRTEVLAAIERRFGDGAVRAMAVSAERLGDDSAALRSLAQRIFKDVSHREGDQVRFELQTMLALPRALQRRVLELAVGRVRDRSGGIEATLDNLAMTFEGAGRNRSFAAASGITIEVTTDHLIVTHPGQSQDR